MYRLLKAHDMRVTMFSSAEEFLVSRDDPPDCLLLDIQLEGISGRELQAHLARGNASYPIVLLTSSREEGHRAAAASLGCAAYIHKTDPAGTLIDAIRHAVARRGSAQTPLHPGRSHES